MTESGSTIPERHPPGGFRAAGLSDVPSDSRSERLFDYARWRYEQMHAHRRDVEAKALGLVKMQVSLIAGVWAVFSLLRSPAPGMAIIIALGAASILLLVAAGFAVRAFAVTDHLLPHQESVAREWFAGYAGAEGIGRFALLMGEAADREGTSTNTKGNRVRVSLILTASSALLFSGCLVWAAARTVPPATPAGSPHAVEAPAE